jgi:hypothetical protein
MRSHTSILSISVFAQKVGIVQFVAARSSAFSREARYLLAFAFKLIAGFSGDRNEELQHRAVLSPCGQIPECPNDAFQLLIVLWAGHGKERR